MWEFIFVVSSVFLLYYLWVHRKFYKLVWKIPGPSLWDLIKDFVKLLQTPHRGSLFLKIMQKYALNYKTSFVYWTGNGFYILVKNPEDMKVVLNSPHCLNRVYFYHFLKRAAGDGVAFFDTPKWNYHRRCLNPSFNMKSVQTYLSIFNKQSKVLVSCMEELCDKKEPINIDEYVKPMAMDAIFETTIGMNLNVQKKSEFKTFFDWTNNSYFWKVKEILEIIDASYFLRLAAIGSQRCLNPILHFDAIYRQTSLYKEEIRGTTICGDAAKMIIEERRKIWEENLEESKNLDSFPEDFEVSKAPLILLDKLFNLTTVENKITHEEMIGNASNIIAGGYETTGLSCAYCMLMLAMFPHHQEKIFEEIKSIMPNKEDEIHCEDLNKYEFLERFIKETLRLFPVVPIIGKEVTDTIQLGNYTIPGGVNILCSKFLLHRDKEIWGPKADDFDPDHFLPENIEKMHPYSYLPFSGGPRNCIGVKYANMLMKVMLIYVVSNFKLHTDLKLNDLDFEVDISLNIFNKHMIYVNKRDN